jgi:Zn-dependent peptidase ImmA (M78 family)
MENKFYIFYNDKMGKGRINHTIMHEIGHIVLGHTEDSELTDAEVRFFAKYALAPPVLIHKWKFNNPYDISVAFDISLEAAGYVFSYFQKWEKYSKGVFSEYEIRTLFLFEGGDAN